MCTYADALDCVWLILSLMGRIGSQLTSLRTVMSKLWHSFKSSTSSPCTDSDVKIADTSCLCISSQAINMNVTKCNNKAMNPTSQSCHGRLS